jgi:DNA-binding beta-propeller fold protein YncE
MGASSSRRSGHRGRSGGGRHRAPRRRIEPHAWLGAGAVTLGLGAAVVAGAGVAYADDGSGSDSNSSPSSSSSSSPSSSDDTTASSASSSVAGTTASDDSEAKNKKRPSVITSSSTSATSSDDKSKKKPFSSFSSTTNEGSAVGDQAADTDAPAGLNNVAQAHVEDSVTETAPISQSNGTTVTPPAAIKSDVVAASPAISVGPVIEPQDTNNSSPIVPLTLATATGTLIAPNEDSPSDTAASSRVASFAATASAAAPQDAAVVAEIKFGDFVEGLRDLVIDPIDGDYVYIGSTWWRNGPDANGVAIINTHTGTMEGYIPVAGTNQQRYLGIGPDGRYVYVSSGSYVSVIDTANNSVSSIPVTFDGTISGLAVSPDSRFVYAGLYDTSPSYNQLAIIDTVSNTVVARIPTSSYITQTRIAVNPTNGDVYVNGDANVLVLDGATGAVRRSIDGVGGRLLMSQDGRQLYAVSSTGLSAIDLETYDIAETPFTVTGQQLGGVAVSPDARYLYVTTSASAGGEIRVSVVDTTTSKVVAEIPVGVEYGGDSLVMSPNGTRLYLYAEVDSNSNSPRVVVIDTTKIHFNDGNSGGENPGGHTNPIDELLNAVSFSNEVTKWLDNLSKTYNLGEVLKGFQFVNGVKNILDGFFAEPTPNILKILDGFSDVGQVFVKGPAAIVLEGAKLVISIVLPLDDKESQEFFDFRVKCMFHKGSGDLSSAEAQQLVDRYTGIASIVNIPADYARYNVGGWFGAPSC